MILVTGASGFVGSRLLKTLSEQNKRIRCFVRSKTSRMNSLNRSMEIVEGNLLDRDAVDAAVNGVKQVVHLAAVIQSYDPELVRQVNVEGTRNLIRSCMEHGVEQFIFFSTINVILPVKNQYSESKLAAECIIQESSLNYTILRPSIIYGEGDTGTIAKLISSVKNNKIIFLIKEGQYKHQPIYVGDIVESIYTLLNNPVKFKKKTLFLVSNDIITFNDLVDLISNLIGVRRYKFRIPLSSLNAAV